MLTVASDFDIIDEALQFFKANVFFRSYEIKVIIYRYDTSCTTKLKNFFKVNILTIYVNFQDMRHY